MEASKPETEWNCPALARTWRAHIDGIAEPDSGGILIDLNASCLSRLRKVFDVGETTPERGQDQSTRSQFGSWHNRGRDGETRPSRTNRKGSAGRLLILKEFKKVNRSSYGEQSEDFGHSVHQAIIVFLLGLLATAVLFDGVAFLTDNPQWLIAAFFMIGAVSCPVC